MLIRINLGGNYCGHDPLKPVLDLPEPMKIGLGGHPRVLTLAKERLVEYFNKPGILPTLNAANLSIRRQRSERRESCILVLEVMLKYCDLVSLRVGIPTLEGFKNITVDFIVHSSGLTKHRVERALRDIKKAGILKSVQPRTRNKDGEIRGLPAIRMLSVNFFRALGLGIILGLERKKAYKRQQKRQARQLPISGAESGRLGLLFESVGNLLTKSEKKASQSLQFDTDKAEARRQELAMQCEVMSEYPEWSEAQIRTEVARRLRPDS